MPSGRRERAHSSQTGLGGGPLFLTTHQEQELLSSNVCSVLGEEFVAEYDSLPPQNYLRRVLWWLWGGGG
jgi:hypothetical protein